MVSFIPTVKPCRKTSITVPKIMKLLVAMVLRLWRRINRSAMKDQILNDAKAITDPSD
jgi:hypothetical protein